VARTRSDKARAGSARRDARYRATENGRTVRAEVRRKYLKTERGRDLNRENTRNWRWKLKQLGVKRIRDLPQVSPPTPPITKT
jgi:hypothetical protein